MSSQPDDCSCGPTCLASVYRYFGRDVPLDALMRRIPQLETGGTLLVQLGCDALRRGFAATIHTWNLQLFDPTWFGPDVDLAERLRAQQRVKQDDGRLHTATSHYLDFLQAGGRVRHGLLEPGLIRDTIADGLPILTGLSATFLYDAMRERPSDDKPDELAGEPVGHFVVLSGFDADRGTITVADPWPDPAAPDGLHQRPVLRVLGAILLGVLTYDASFLVLHRP